MCEWRTIKDLGQVFDGPHATPKKTAEGPIYLGINAIDDDGSLVPEQFAHLSEDDFPKWTKRVEPQTGDIVFSYEATLGRYAIIPDNFRGCLGRRLGIVRPDTKLINPKWLYYYFFTPQWKTFIDNHTFHGSTVDRISIEDFPDYPVLVPDRKTQDAIADLLGAIDDKIQINQRICKELEETVSLIYDYWFTQFDFPNENGNPYRLSGGNISSVHKVEKPLPWSLGQLSDFVQISTNNILPSAMPAIVEHYSIPAFDSMQYPSFDPSSDIQSSKYQIPSNSFLISKLNPQFKRVWNPLYLTNSPVCSTEFVVLKCKRSIATSYIFSVLNSDRFQSFMQSNAVASTGSRSRVQPDRILEYTLPVPPEKILCAFNKAAQPVLESEKTIRIENHSLMNIRKWLMSMLMNGQVKASELI